MTGSRTGPSPTGPSWVARLGVSVVALGSVLAGKALIACRLRRAPEGWRRTIGVLLRSESTRFALSAFSVRIPGAASDRDAAAIETRAAAALRAFLDDWPDAHFRLEWRPAVTVRRRTDLVDLVLLRFGAGGDLLRVEPHLADRGPRPSASSARARVHDAVVVGYNRTRQLPEIDRPAALLRAVLTALTTAGARGPAPELETYARRLLSSCVLSFETVDLSNPAERFRPPDFCARRTLGYGFLSVVMRPDLADTAVDVWVSAHHVGLDGVPLQELVSGLERAWGLARNVVFPSADRDRPFMDVRACSVPGERDVRELLTFVDFSPLWRLRDALNTRHRNDVGGPITVGALLAWLLSHEPEFAGVRIASTVDVAASDGYDRDVDVVPLRPADFRAGEDFRDGLVEFAREFNRLTAASRMRRSPLRVGMQTAGLLPAWVHAHAVRSNPAALDDTFGSLCVTIVRDAKVFVSPMTDLGLGQGFFAIGSASLPSSDGGRVASVSIKGDAGAIGNHPAILRRAIARCDRWLQAGSERARSS